MAGSFVACTSTGTERKGSVPVGVYAKADNDTVAASSSLTVALVGDVMPGTTFPKERLPEKDGAQLFLDARNLLKRADIAAGNMEGAIADTGETTKKKAAMNYAFRIPTRYGRLLSEAGFDFMSMANNHVFDFGMAGVKSTEAVLNANKIAYAGIIGRRESVVVERGGVKYGFCAFGHNSYTLKHNDNRNVSRIIRQLKREADVVIVSFHGGAEGAAARHLPQGKEEFLGEDRGNLRAFAHYCIDNGADIVYGHGPHVARAVELYKGHFIAYSLGNFCTPLGINITGVSGHAPLLMLKINKADGKFEKGRIYSFVQKYGVGPRADLHNSAAKDIRELTEADIIQSGLNIATDGTITKKTRK